jgi:ElaB/YqjD/DUF883 family membrane-anchored ribosome-binding protein
MSQNTQFRNREKNDEQATTGDFKEKAAELKERATDQFERIAGQVEGAARSVIDQGREVGEQAQAVAKNFRGAVDRSIKEQPLTTLALAAAIGFVLGALWKS